MMSIIVEKKPNGLEETVGLFVWFSMLITFRAERFLD